MKLGTVQTLILLIVQYPRVIDSVSRYCPWSIHTQRNVDACPETKQDVEKAAKNKNCETLAFVQNCTSVTNFKYHCVMNELENALVEVCAPVYFIHGFCAEYNIQGALIQEHYNIKCDEVEPPCAQRYKSSEAYLYKGCYDIIREKNKFSTMEATTIKQNTSMLIITNDIPYDGSTNDWKIALGVTGCILVLVFTCILGFVFHRKKCGHCKRAKEKQQKDQEDVGLLPKNVRRQGKEIFASDSATDKLVLAVARGESLREVVKKDTFDVSESSEENKVETEKYIAAYTKASSYFVQTRLYKQCQHTLEQEGVAILAGLPGCGKTLTAVQIMQTPYYKDWIKRKFTSWEHFLLLEATENTLVYIDNIFDGYMYRHELQRWWDSLCYYYQKYIKRKHIKVHLLITVKEHVIDKICEYMRMEIPIFNETCIIRDTASPLTDDEKRKILDAQIKYANELRKIKPPMVEKEFFSQVKQLKSPIGFPLCAHLFAFEERSCKKDIMVFQYPIRYIVNQIADEIERDESNCVKALLLILMFSYPRSDIQDPTNKLELKYGQTCQDFLESMCPKAEEMLEKLQPLQFLNLREIAEDLEDKMLVKHSGDVYHLKHQIYVDGVVGYFCAEHFDVAVEFFPLDLLREQDFIGFHATCHKKLIERFKEEIKRKHLSEVFACKIFRQHAFEVHFSEKLEIEKGIEDWVLYSDESSTYHLPIIFWTSKYLLRSLSRMVMKLIERENKNIDRHFYLARFGECCAYDENYIKSASYDPEHLRKSVWNYKNVEGNTILHITLSLERSDYDAYLILDKLLIDIEIETDNSFIESLLKTILNQRSCSRILCLMDLMGRKMICANTKESSISKIVNDLNLVAHNTYLELECLVRICLLLIGNIDKLPPDSSDIQCRSKYVQEVLRVSSNKQAKMVKCIENCIQDLIIEDFENQEIALPNFQKNMAPDLRKAVKKSVHILAKMETFEK